MRRRVGWWVVGAGATALLASFAIDARPPTRSIVVLARDLPEGTQVSRAALDFRELPERYLEERHVAAEDLERLLGLRSAHALAAGSALLWTDLDDGSARTLASLVPVGMRAYALREPELGFVGLLHAGDRVDVLASTQQQSEAETLLENVLVLSVSGEGRIALAASARDAGRLAAREAHGALRVSLRNPHDLALAVVEGRAP